MLAAAVFSAATCVTSFEAQGPAGPWTGEFLNGESYSVAPIGVNATITDRNGATARPYMRFCPGVAGPGESIPFEIGAPDHVSLAPPLTATVPRFDVRQGVLLPPRPHRLLVGQSTTDTAPPRNAGYVYNASSDKVFFGVTTCAVVRGSEGDALRVSEPIDLSALDPGEGQDVTYLFSEAVSGRWTIEFDTRGYAVNLVRAGSDGSRTLDLGSFEITLPETWVYVPLQGIDSFVGGFEGDGVQASFDYGMYSDNLIYEPDGSMKYEDDPRYVVSNTTIDGRKARIVHPAPGVTGIVAVNIEASKSSEPFGLPTSITIFADSVPPEKAETLLEIFRGVELD